MPKASHEEHKDKAKRQVSCGVITVSDTRTEETDTSGKLIREMLDGAGHAAKAYHIIKDDPSQIQPLLEAPDVSEVMINGPGPVWIERRGGDS